MESVNYKDLYHLQDRVLEIVFGAETTFYLTGGTCLNRFFFEKRYSADLDFFSNDNNLFREDVRSLIDAFDATDWEIETLVDTRDFVRILFKSLLKVDLVNDRVYRLGKSIRTPKGFVLDNLENIAANKICDVLGRDEPKDLFDLYTLFSNAELNWKSILSASAKKCALDKEILEYRLNSFPIHLVDLLPVLSPSFTLEFKKDYFRMVAAIGLVTSESVK